MAILNGLEFPHWEVVRPPLPDLLRHIGQQPFARRFYLAGGTALALQLGHRVSVDLDFFSERDGVATITRHEIIDGLRSLRLFALENVDGNLLLEVEGAQGECKYPYARDFEVEAVRSLTFFENADRDVQPELLIHVPWEEVRLFFIDQARVLSRHWLNS